MSALDINFVREGEMPYPHILISEDNITNQQLDYMLRLLNAEKPVEDADNLVSVLYNYNEDNYLCIGTIYKEQVSSFVEMMDFNITGYLEKDIPLDDSDDVSAVLGTVF